MHQFSDMAVTKSCRGVAISLTPVHCIQYAVIFNLIFLFISYGFTSLSKMTILWTLKKGRPLLIIIIFCFSQLKRQNRRFDNKYLSHFLTVRILCWYKKTNLLQFSRPEMNTTNLPNLYHFFYLQQV